MDWNQSEWWYDTANEKSMIEIAMSLFFNAKITSPIMETIIYIIGGIYYE